MGYTGYSSIAVPAVCNVLSTYPRTRLGHEGVKPNPPHCDTMTVIGAAARVTINGVFHAPAAQGSGVASHPKNVKGEETLPATGLGEWEATVLCRHIPRPDRP